MRILIDDGLASLSTLSGIGHQSHNLWKHLSKTTECDITRYQFLKNYPRILRRLVYLGVSNLQPFLNEYDIIHYQNYYVPLLAGSSKRVVTVHDVGAFRHPETVSPIYRRYIQSIIREAVKRADAVITPSAFSRQEVLDLLPGTASNHVFVCTNGIREVFFSLIPDESDLREVGLAPFSYFFFLGVLTKRKNLSFLLKVFTEAKERRLLQRETRLVLAGKDAWDTNEIRRFFRKDMGVTVLGYLPDERVAALYRFSKAFVFPSIYEGYGIPIIEAMSQGAPVIASDIPTNRELSTLHNNNVKLFELGDKEGLLQLLVNADRVTDHTDSKVGYGDLTRYRYDNVATEHLNVYKTVCSDTRRLRE